MIMSSPPAWIDSLKADRVEWRTFKTQGGLELEAWAVTIPFASYRGQRYDELPWDCRKKGGLVAADDAGISCAEVEVAKRLIAAGFADAGWLSTCGQRLWSTHQRSRRTIRDELLARYPSTAQRLAVNGSGAPDVVALRGPHPVFVECKGSESLQDNQVAWITTLLRREERRELFAVVLRASLASGQSPTMPVLGRSDEPAMVPEITTLFEDASTTAPGDRLRLFRDPIASFGEAAIPHALRELDRRPGSAFPVAVIEAIGQRGHAESAAAALREVATRHSALRDLADAARGRLPVNARPTSSGDRPPSIPIDQVPQPGRRPPRPVGYCDFQTASGAACGNLGRYPRGRYWACSSHAKAHDPTPIVSNE